MTHGLRPGVRRQSLVLLGALLTSALATMPARATPQWTFLGLGGQRVWTLETAAPYMFAGTDSGLYRKPLASLDTLWTPMPLDTVSVVSLLALDDSTLLAAVAYYPDEYPALQIYRSVDQGLTWSLSQSPYDSPTIRGLEANPTDPDTVYAAGYRPLRSADRGSTWSQAASLNTNLAFVLPSPSIPGRVWLGGESFFFSPALYRSDDGGDTWYPTTAPFPSSENSVRCLAIDPTDEARMVAGMEGYLERSVNGGSSWSIVYALTNYYISDVAIDPQDHDHLIATGFQSGNGVGQRPTILVSTDGGATWWTAENESGPSTFSGSDVELFQETGQTVALVAGTGVYRVDGAEQVGVGDLPERPGKVRLLPPMLQLGGVLIRYEGVTPGEPVRLTILDLQGRRIRSIEAGVGGAGPLSVLWKGDDDRGVRVPDGIYFLRLHAGAARLSQKLPILR